jgi:hypothetical protein
MSMRREARVGTSRDLVSEYRGQDAQTATSYHRCRYGGHGWRALRSGRWPLLPPGRREPRGGAPAQPGPQAPVPGPTHVAKPCRGPPSGLGS